MATHFISEDEYDDFMDEEPTRPWTPLLTAQQQLNAAGSVARLTALAQRLAPEPVAEGHWTERLTSATPADLIDLAEAR